MVATKMLEWLCYIRMWIIIFIVKFLGEVVETTWQIADLGAIYSAYRNAALKWGIALESI